MPEGGIPGMKDDDKTRDQLIEELDLSRRTIADLEHAVSKSKQAAEELKKQVDLLDDLARERTVELRAANEVLNREFEEHKRIEAALHENEEKYRIHFSLSNDVMFHWDNQFRVKGVSPNVQRILGYRPEEIVGKQFHELNVLDPADLDEALENAMLLLSGEKVYSSIFRFITKDGAGKFGELSEVPIIRDGKVVEMICVAREITERIEILDSLREREETAQALLNACTDSLLLLDPSGTVLALNDTASRILGKTAKEILHSPITDHVTRDVIIRRKPYFDQVISSGKPLRFTDENLGRSFAISIFPAKDSQGKVFRIAVYCQEIIIPKPIK
jgi:PAS domain S-box-containing protein